MMPRLLITGTRHGWEDTAALDRILRERFEALCQQHDTEVVLLVHGDASGIDRQARDIWVGHGLPHEPHPANWKAFGNAAGPLRNSEMVDAGASVCLAFPHEDSRGTYDCLNKALAAGIPVQTFYEP